MTGTIGYLRVKDVAAIAGVSLPTAYKLAKGPLKAERPAGSKEWRIDPEVFREWYEGPDGPGWDPVKAWRSKGADS